MDHIRALKCLICGKEYGTAQIEYVCPDHGNEGIVDVLYDYDGIKRNIKKEDLLHATDYSMWRYKPFLPVSHDSMVPPLGVGCML